MAKSLPPNKLAAFGDSSMSGITAIQNNRAEPYLRRAMEGSEHTLGADHQHTLQAVNNLASLLHDNGRLEEAEPLLRQALDSHNKLLGVVISLVGVGILLLAMALAAGDSEGQAWGSPLALASEPRFAVGFAFCFGWWWVLLGRPGLRTKAD